VSRLRQTLLALLMFACASAPAIGAGIPLAQEAQTADSLPTQLRAALLDYQQRLPSSSTLRWTEFSPNGPIERHWSDASQAFWQACRKSVDACGKLLQAQLQTLDRAARSTPQGQSASLTASVLSAIADLCSNFPTSDRPFEVCGLNLRLNQTALAWLAAGNDALFVQYLHQYSQQRSQYLAWLANSGQVPSQSTQAALPEVPPWLAALDFEFLGHVSAARSAWLVVFLQEAASTDSFLLRLSNLHLARLSWRLGDTEVAQEFARLYQQRQLQAKAAVPCAERSEAWRNALAANTDDPASAPQRLTELIQADCGFSKGLVETGIDTLLQPNPSPGQLAALGRLLAIGLAACANDACPPERQRQLRLLSGLVGSQTSTLAALATTQLTWLDQQDPVLDADLRLSWAMGARLLALPGLQTQGLALLQRVQEALLLRVETSRSASFEDQRDLSRYDGLHRAVARAAVLAGQTLAPARTEVLRAQTMLRRLRLQRWAGDLADMRNPAVQARLQERLAQVDQMRAAASTFPAGGLRQVLVAMADDATAMAQLQTVQDLAGERAKANGNPPDWLEQALGFDALGRIVNAERNPLATDTDALARDEIYLSWLQVPGGYVATLVSFDESASSKAVRMPDGAFTLNRFIPLSPAQNAALLLYRELMAAGAGANRGASASAPAGSEQAGLLLRGMPVWQTEQGDFVAQKDSPANGRRVAGLDQLGAAIYGWLMAPLQASWKDAKRLIISPDGALALLPFEVLPVGSGRLLDKIDITYAQSLQVHGELRRRATRAPNHPGSLLSLADPNYLPTMSASDASLPAWTTRLRWQSLPGTRRESDALRVLFPAMRQLLGAAASRQSLLDEQRSGQLEKIAVLHFATHGYSDEQRSALILSMDQGAGQAYLLDTDVAQLRLNSDLVLLSACDSGLGRSVSGEGVVGLPYAFMLAGNINTVMSLWPVDDAGAAAFIPAFLAKARQGMDLISALNATKRDFAAGRHGQRFADPRIWAAFVQYGVDLRLNRANSPAR
jgi:CHAT domain-containing protein